MRRVVVGIALTAFMSVMPLSAHATAPSREPVEIPPAFVLADHCTFNIQIEIVKNNEVLTTFYDVDGAVVRQSVTGALIVRLTNKANPEHSLLFNISGAGQYHFLPDGSTELQGSGPWLHFGIADRPGEVLLMYGRFTATITENGEFFLTELPSNVQDVCALLS
jgi:hypothetical protein